MNNEKFFNDVYDILVNLGGAFEVDRISFIDNHLCKQFDCHEWRFRGKLGFGGKYRSITNTVDYYREDETPEREALIIKINDELKKLKESAE